ncbi:type IV pilus assembly protein PilM [bacterium]|nr:MAG: type IV pilus assembly protein PilM [bacterium]
MQLSFFSFLQKKESVAFDIGSHSIKLVQMKQAKKGWELMKMGMAELPPEAIVDGSVIDSMTVTNTLKELIKEHGIKVKDAVSALTGHSVIIKKVSFPTMTEEELAESIQWEAEQYIPFPIAEVNIDFQILGADTEGRGQMDVMLVAVKKDVINDYTNVIKEAGLNPVVIDVDSFALENMLEVNYATAPGETCAMVNIGASITSISVIAGGMTIFTRSIPMGGNQFTEEIQRQMNISFKDAEALKIGKGDGGSDEATLALAVESISTNLSFEVKRSVDFFLGASHGTDINKIYLSGGGAKIKGLIALLQDKTSIPVEIVNPFKGVALGVKDVDEERLGDIGPHFGVAVGLATRRFGDR